MSNGKLFYDDEFDALQQMVANSHRTFKEVACFLFPELKPESAYAKLKACFNVNGDERLKPGQVVAAMNFCEQYDPLYFQCDETLHGRPPRVAPQDEETRYIETVRACTQTIEKALGIINKMRERRPAVARVA